MLPINTLNLAQHDNWVAFVITGIVTAPLIPLGLGPVMYVVRESHFEQAKIDGLSNALQDSFENFGFEASKNISLNDPKLLLIPVEDLADETIKNVLIVSDMALAFLNKKYFSAKTRFLFWDRKSGHAIGAKCNNGKWEPILKSAESFGPAIVSAIEADFWDWFLSSSLKDNLCELGTALYKCIEWERESQISSHITHSFAFNWVSLEAMMPKDEYQESYLVRRLSLIIGAPRGADSKKIMSAERTKIFFDSYKNANSKKWVKAIEDMYRYRCAILHNGSSDLSSIDINPNKVDWFIHLTRTLSTRLTEIAVNALIDGVETLDDFWSEYAIDYLYSDKNKWAKNGFHFQDNLINFDWESEKYPNIF